MLNGVTGQLVRRGVDAVRTGQFNALPYPPMQQQDENLLDELKRRFQQPSSIIMLAGTFILFSLVTAGFEYAIRIVAVNLAIAEDTTGNGSVAPRKAVYSDEEPDATIEKAPLLEIDAEEAEKDGMVPTLFPKQPITRKLRTTMRHLSSVGGFKARFRGIQYFALYAVLNAILGSLLTMLFAAFVPAFANWIGFTLSAVACSRIHAVWTHATIAAPSEQRVKRLSKAYLPKEQNKHLILPTIRVRVTHGVSAGALCMVTMFSNRRITSNKVNGLGEAIFLILLPIMTGIACGLFVILPAQIALVRTEAALFPENESAIVPLDRSFGGRVFLDTGDRRQYVFRNLMLPGAYKTFDKDTFKRVVKMHVKLFAILSAFTFIFVHAIAFEIVFIVGDLGPKIAEWLHNHPEIFEEVNKINQMSKRWLARK